MNPWANEGSDW